MRRFTAFIIMSITIILSIVFGTQVILDNRVLSTEYGGGTEFVYQITQRDDIDLNENTIKKEIVDRFDKSNVKSANIDLLNTSTDTLESYQLRVKAGANTTDELNSINQVIKYNGILTFCTSTDECVTQSEMLQESNPAQVVYSGTSRGVGLKLKSATSWTDLMSKADEIENEDTKSKIYVWLDKAEGDTYQTAYDENDPKLEMQKKIVATLTSESYNEDLTSIVLTSDYDGNAFTNSTVQTFVKAFNSPTYSFNIKYQYQSKFGPSLGTNAYLYSMIALLIGFLLISGVMIGIYGVSGLISSVSVLATSEILMLIFSFLGFPISPASLFGIVVTMVLGFFISVSYFERIREELRKPRNLAKANREGYSKNFLTVVDSCLVLFIVSILSFAIAKGTIQVFASVALIGSILTFIVTNYLNKWLMYWMCTSEKYKDKAKIYGLNPKNKFEFFRIQKNNVNPLEEVEEKSSHLALYKPKKKLIISSILCGTFIIGMAASMLGFGFGTGKVFNSINEYDNSHYITLNLKLTNLDKEDTRNYFNSEENFLSFLENSSDNPIKDRNDDFGNLIPTYNNLVYNVSEEKGLTDNDITTNINASFLVDANTATNSDYITQLRTVINNLDFENKNDALIVGSTAEPLLEMYQAGSIYLLAGLALLWVFLYTFIRFGLSSAVSTLFANTISLTFAYFVISLTRIPFNTFTSYVFLVLPVLLSFMLMPLFNKNRSVLKDKKLTKAATQDERAEVLIGAFNYCMPMFMIHATASILIGVPLIIASGMAGISFGLVMFFEIFAQYLFYTSVMSSYLAIKSNFSLALLAEKREDKNINKPKKVSRRQQKLEKFREEEKNSPHESIVVGINEYR